MKTANTISLAVLTLLAFGLASSVVGGEPQAESLILFIGDGMGPEIVTVAKIYSEEALGTGLSMVALANTGRSGLATTHSADRLVTDSAAGATALATGVKTGNGIVGMTPDGASLENLLEKAVRQGKAVGVVTTTSVTDATPAAFLSHVRVRGYETDVAAQIVESDASVVMGGGKNYFLPAGDGKRADGRDLIEEARGKGFAVAFDRDGLQAASGGRILGLFAAEDLPYESERRTYEVPSLAEMMTRALQVLTADPDGFVLVVEGGRIDHAEHEHNLPGALAEILAFDAAIGRAMDYQESDSSLVLIVTADHDTGGPGLTAGAEGYPRTSDVSRLVNQDCPFIKWLSEDHVGTMVPLFARGPGEDLFSGIIDNTEVNRRAVMLLQLDGVGAAIKQR
jgi:alkaline phosphatase